MHRLADIDPEVAKALRGEAQRQQRNLELIASENFVSEAVLEAVGSVLTNKYAEGYPGRRYYGGGERVGAAENLAIERAKAPFWSPQAHLQPPPRAPAEKAADTPGLKPGGAGVGPRPGPGGGP